MEMLWGISAGVGCGSSISQLLLSADNAVVSMGCEFISSLVMPLLEGARGNATLPSNYNSEYNNEGLGACREAALAIATSSACRALMGGGIQAPHYHAALMDLFEASLLATGSMCGSPTGPGESDF
jgi:hypothetical protein